MKRIKRKFQKEIVKVVLDNDNPLITLEENITSLRLSGYTKRNGSAKIYLGNYLVLDTSSLENKNFINCLKKLVCQ